MADFSSLCPLFNTGVYGCITLPDINLASRSTTNSFEGGLPFGRSVIVTAAHVKKHTDISTTAALKLFLCRASTWGATKTVFASIQLSGTVTTQALGKYLAMTTTAKTFSATQVLHLKVSSKETNAKNVSVIVRYKEK